MTAARAAGALALAACALAAGAFAQTMQPYHGAAPRKIPGTNVPEAALPYFFSAPPPSESPRVARPAPPLDPEIARLVRRAQDLRLAGLPERALDTLRVAARTAPHHPYVVLETARAHLARDDWSAAAALLRAERAAQRDSLLGSQELVFASERLARPRDAAQAAVETWVVSAPDGQWAVGVLLRLLPQDARGVTEPLRAAQARLPGRGDLARGLALVLSRQGRTDEAVRTLAAADRPSLRPLRQWFAEEMLYSPVPGDSLAATEALVSLAGDTLFAPVLRLAAARRAVGLAAAGGRTADVLPRLARGLERVPPAQWDDELLLAVARGLRESGRGAEARTLLERAGRATASRPELALERAWAQLREGPPAAALGALDSLARTWPPARFPLAEALFWAGRPDSALAQYKRVALDAASPDAVPALERTYLIEEKPDDPALRAFGEIAWERWRGGAPRALRLADSLWRALPRTAALHAHAAIQLGELRAANRDWAGALVPLLAVADSLPGDRLASLARQRAGEALLAQGDSRRALAQFEECLARYPRAWNAPEVRRYVERLRRESRL